MMPKFEFWRREDWKFERWVNPIEPLRREGYRNVRTLHPNPPNLSRSPHEPSAHPRRMKAILPLPVLRERAEVFFTAAKRRPSP